MSRLAAITLHLILGVAAIWAGLSFMRDPTGRSVGVDPEWLAGSPFPDYRIPGAFLAIVIGGSNLVTTLLLWRRARPAPWASFATGTLLVAWIAIQSAIIGYRHWSQGLWWAVFASVTALGLLLVRGSHSAPPAQRGR